MKSKEELDKKQTNGIDDKKLSKISGGCNGPYIHGGEYFGIVFYKKGYSPVEIELTNGFKSYIYRIPNERLTYIFEELNRSNCVTTEYIDNYKNKRYIIHADIQAGDMVEYLAIVK